MAPSIWRRPGTRTFQLVHRSQRDPLINDPTASDRVLKAIDKGQKRGNDGASSYAPSEMGDFVSEDDDAAAAAGDAAAYGILFDDADDYDYMQHLRSVGGAADAYLVEAPAQAKQSKGKGKAAAGGFQLNEPQQPRFQVSEDALPSHPLDELSYTEITSSKADETGLRPDLDPSIREVLEALDDDAYAADDGTGTDDEDAFWNGVMQGGEVDDVDEQGWSDEEEEDGVEAAAKGVKKMALQGEEEEDEGEEEGSWAAVKRFKAAQAGAGGASDDEDDFASEGGDTIADLKAAIAKRPARRGAPSAVGSAFSMSSSAMFRNEQLRTLDDRFDQIEKLYAEDSDDSWGGSDEEVDSDGEPLEGEFHGPQREDLEQIMDDFLSRFEVIGGKMRPVLDPLHVPDLVDASGSVEAGTIAANASKLDRLRQELASLDLGGEEEGEDPELTARRREKERILAAVERQWREETSRKKKERMPMIHILEDEREKRWDCETVLSTYSNLSNHPRMLRLRDSMGKKKSLSASSSAPVAQIKIDPKTGFPTVNGESVLDARPNARKGQQQAEEDTIMEEDEEDEEDYEIRETVKRPRDEAASDKKARKAAVKAERASRRAEKKSTKETFSSEVKRQKRAQGRRVADGAAADIRSGQEGVKRLA
ncbi:hypothetical protein JCM6882_003282 [Rhodosporidiobolus microsporus]